VGKYEQGRRTSYTTGTLCAMALEIFVKIMKKHIDKAKKWIDNESTSFGEKYLRS
jgi:hypothetical protein